MLRLACLLAIAALSWGVTIDRVAAQASGGSPISYLYCYSGSVPTSPASWTPCSASNPLPVTGTITVTGAVSNATSAVATSATNVPTVAYNYGFNGTTWDQLQVDASKFLKVNVAAGSVTVVEPVLSTTSSTALAANLVINAAASGLYSFTVSADSTLYAATWYIMIYNATSAPVDGAVTPLKCYEMPTNTYTYTAAFPNPVPFSTGIVIGVSTTGCFTKTASTHAAFISGDYK